MPSPCPIESLRLNVRSPEKSLMCAVMDRALRDLAYSLDPRDKTSAQEWFASNDTKYPFAFVCLCRHLDLDASVIRAKIADGSIAVTHSTVQRCA